MDLIFIGLIVSLNFIVIIYKYRLRRFVDATFDMGLLVLIGIVFGNSYNALVVGTFASAFISLYLFFKPLSLNEIIHGTRIDDGYNSAKQGLNHLRYKLKDGEEYEYYDDE